MAEENRFPPAMREMGTPEVMSPMDAAADSPFVEVRQPLPMGEVNELRDPESATDLGADSFEIE